jgi:transcriptional regulator with XRE-family HTH domain
VGVVRARHKVVPASEQALLGAYLRKVRLKAGISQREVAVGLDLPQSFMSKVERGERQLQVVEFVLICRLLGLNPAQAISDFLESLPVLSALSESSRVRRKPKN